jgi:hypothetical protein
MAVRTLGESMLAMLQAAEPAVGSVDQTTFPTASTATHNDVEAQEMP